MHGNSKDQTGKKFYDGLNGIYFTFSFVKILVYLLAVTGRIVLNIQLFPLRYFLQQIVALRLLSEKRKLSKKFHQTKSLPTIPRRGRPDLLAVPIAGGKTFPPLNVYVANIMEAQPDFKELLELFNAHHVKYLVVGGYALAFHGVPRFTGDLDIFVKPDPDNAPRILIALAAFGFGPLGLMLEDFIEGGKSRPTRSPRSVSI